MTAYRLVFCILEAQSLRFLLEGILKYAESREVIVDECRVQGFVYIQRDKSSGDTVHISRTNIRVHSKVSLATSK